MQRWPRRRQWMRKTSGTFQRTTTRRRDRRRRSRCGSDLLHRTRQETLRRGTRPRARVAPTSSLMVRASDYLLPLHCTSCETFSHARSHIFFLHVSDGDGSESEGEEGSCARGRGRTPRSELRHKRKRERSDAAAGAPGDVRGEAKKMRGGGAHTASDAEEAVSWFCVPLHFMRILLTI